MGFHLLSRKQTVTAAQVPAPCAGTLLRSLPPLSPGDPLLKAMHRFRSEPFAALPVTHGLLLIGWVSEERIADLAVVHGADTGALPVSAAMTPVPLVVDPAATLEDLISLAQASAQPVIPVATLDGCYLGCLLRADLLAASVGRLAPPSIGGMATPLGVYLTNGVVSGGVGTLALMLAGAALVTVYWLAQFVLTLLLGLSFRATGATLLRDLFQIMADVQLTSQLSPEAELWRALLALVFLLSVYLCALRFLPRISGFHAAEHQAVNAIEAGEPLTPDVVSRMSRVHPRCGTNLWSIAVISYAGLVVAASLMATRLGRANLPVIATGALYLIVLLAISWRKIGGWLQQHFTTRPAAPREIASGIRAGEEVLRRYGEYPLRPGTPLLRVWRMGLLQVGIGLLVMGSLLSWLGNLLDGWWHFLVK